jgi:hypothetical protein
MTWEDVQSWCDDISAWIIEIGEEGEVRKAWPKGIFPLKADREKDDLDEDKDVLAYITVWVCCKIKKRAPAHLESRMLLLERFKGPWQEIYCKLIHRFENNLDYKDIDVFSLAS